MAASNSNNTSTFMEEIQRYECLYNKFSKDYKNRRTIYRPNLKPMLSSIFSLSSSSQNNTEKQITSQKSSSSSIDCRHFNFDLVGKKIPSASLFYRLIRYKRFNGNQVIARIASIASVVFHHGNLFSSDRDDSSYRDDYLETSLKRGYSFL